MKKVQLRVEKTKMWAFNNACDGVIHGYEIISEEGNDVVLHAVYEYPHQLFYLGKITEINVKIEEIEYKRMLCQ